MDNDSEGNKDFEQADTVDGETLSLGKHNEVNSIHAATDGDPQVLALESRDKEPMARTVSEAEKNYTESDQHSPSERLYVVEENQMLPPDSLQQKSSTSENISVSESNSTSEGNDSLEHHNPRTTVNERDHGHNGKVTSSGHSKEQVYFENSAKDSSTENLPIILNVRGNANDLDVTYESDQRTDVPNVNTVQEPVVSISRETKMILEKNSATAVENLSMTQKNHVRCSPDVAASTLPATSNSVTFTTSQASRIRFPPDVRISLDASKNKCMAVSDHPINMGIKIVASTKGISQSEFNSIMTQAHSELSTKSDKSATHQKLDDGSQSQQPLGASKFFKIISNSINSKQVGYRINLLTPSQDLPSSDAGNVGKIGPNISTNDAYQSLQSTSTILVNTQKTRVTSAPLESNDSQSRYKPICSLIASSDGVQTSQKLIDFVDNKSNQIRPMSRQDILNSDLLKVSKNIRKDLTKQYVCNVCGDEFHNEEFLKFHLERKVFVMQYLCGICVEVLTFYNKCLFWQHIQKECSSMSEERIIKEKGHMKLTPYLLSNTEENLLVTAPNTRSEKGPMKLTPYLLSNTEENLLVTATNPRSENGHMKLTPYFLSNTEEDVLVTAPNPRSTTKTCPHCKENLESPEQWTSHFQRVNSSTKHTCSTCSLVLFNPCSLAAHEKIHTIQELKEPFLCPECGVTLPYSEDLKSILEHLDSCCHFDIWPGITCRCGEIFKSFNQTKEHILKEHIKLLFNCRLCNQLFPFIHLLYKHYQTQHPHDMCTASAVAKCTLCNKHLGSPSSLQSHVEFKVYHGHLDRCKIYRCMLCPNVNSLLFKTANSLKLHIENSHTHRPNRCTLCFTLFKKRQNLVTHLLSKNCPKKLSRILHICFDSLLEKEPPFCKSNYIKIFQVKSLNIANILVSGSAQQKEKVSTESNAATSQAVKTVTSQAVKTVTSQVVKTVTSQAVKTVTSQAVKTVTSQAVKTVTSQAVKTVTSQAVTKSPLSNSNGQKHATETQNNQFTPFHPSLPSLCEKRPPTSKTSIGEGNYQCDPPSPFLPSQFNMSGKRRSTTNSTTDGRKYQCHLCKICLTGSQNFDKHKYRHRPSDLMTGRTHCVICKKMVANSSMTSHMVEHQDNGVIVCSLCHRRDFPNLSEAREHSKNWCFYKEESGWGSAYFRDSENQREPVPEVNLNAENAKDICNVREVNKSCARKRSEKLQESDPNEKRSFLFPCLMCGFAFSTKSAKEDHVSRVHDGTRTLFCCILCKRRGIRKTFNKKRMASLHISRKHRVMDPVAVSKLILEEELNMSSGQIISSEVSNQEKTNVSPPKRLRLEAEGNFLCGKCGFSDGRREVFEGHIKTHNLTGEPQCPECGLCFTVNVALQKHLFAIHKIKNVDEYMKEHGIEEAVEEEVSDDEPIEPDPTVDVVSMEEIEKVKAKPSGRSKKKSTSLSSNIGECTVCYKKFTCEIVLKSHMRNHGMAFIRSRRHKDKFEK